MEFTAGDRVRCCTGGDTAGKFGTIAAMRDRGMVDVDVEMGDGYIKSAEFTAGMLEKVQPASPPPAPSDVVPPGMPAPSADVAALADDSVPVSDALAGSPPVPVSGDGQELPRGENPEPPPVSQQPDPPPAPPLPPGTV